MTSQQLGNLLESTGQPRISTRPKCSECGGSGTEPGSINAADGGNDCRSCGGTGFADIPMMFSGIATRFECWLPMPPSLNNLFPTGKTGRRFRSKEYEAWIVNAPMGRGGAGAHIHGAVRAIYRMHFLDKRRRDIANYEKAVSDLLVSRGIIEDDCMIDELHIYRGALEPVARVHVVLERI